MFFFDGIWHKILNWNDVCMCIVPLISSKPVEFGEKSFISIIFRQLFRMQVVVKLTLTAYKSHSLTLGNRALNPHKQVCFEKFRLCIKEVNTPANARFLWFLCAWYHWNTRNNFYLSKSVLKGVYSVRQKYTRSFNILPNNTVWTWMLQPFYWSRVKNSPIALLDVRWLLEPLQFNIISKENTWMHAKIYSLELVKYISYRHKWGRKKKKKK